LGYRDDDLYDWEKRIDHDETDSLVKMEPQDDDRKTIPKNISRSPKQNATDFNHIDAGSPSKYLQNNRRMMKSPSLFRKGTDSNHNLPLKQSHRLIDNQQRSPYDFDRLKPDLNILNQTGTGDQQQIVHRKVWSQPESRSPDTLTRRSTHLNIIDPGQATSNGLLTYISQQFSNAAAPGPPSLFSQWSPYNGETFTDDDILKGNKSNSSRADERATTLSGERTSPANIRIDRPSSSTKNNSTGRTPFVDRIRKSENVSDNEDQNNLEHLPPKHQRSTERAVEVPFGTYVTNTRKNNNGNQSMHRRQQTPPPPSGSKRFSRKK
jgi:hypothetical protein